MRARLKALAEDRSGAVLVYVGLTLAALLGVGALAVDGAQMYVTKTRLQVVADAAALAAAQELPDKAKATAAALGVAEANMPSAQNGAVLSAADLQFGVWNPDTRTFTAGGTANAVRVLAGRTSARSNPLPLTLASVFGSTFADVSAQSVGLKRMVEIALVLDNTGSMKDGGKIEALRKASEDFLDIVYEKANGGVKVAVVPYVASVNIKAPGAFDYAWMVEGGPKNATVSDPWGVGNLAEVSAGSAAKWEGDNFTASSAAMRVNPWSLFEKMKVAWKGCVEARPEPYDTEDTAPASIDTRWAPYLWPDEVTPDASTNNYILDDVNGSATAQGFKDGSKWAQLQADTAKYARDLRVKVKNQNAIQETGGMNVSTYGPNKSCGDPIQPLTTDKGVVADKVRNMVPWHNGGTVTSEGLFWGWAVLSPTAPFTEGAPYNADRVKKIAVIMTDGDNLIFDGENPPPNSKEGGNKDSANKSDYGAWGYMAKNRLGTTSPGAGKAKINAKMLKICDNMKAKGIEVYTIILQVPDKDAKDTFRKCATREDMYYDAGSNNAMKDAFKEIAKRIGELRLVS
nr:pilus assembly protein TadG-related protein [Caulobacter sp. 17J65-9]